MDTSTFGNYRVKTGLKAVFAEETLGNGNKLSVFGDVALSYTDNLFNAPISMTVGGSAGTFTPETSGGVGLGAGLGIDIASPNNKFRFTTEFRYASDENSDSTFRITTGLKFKM